MNSPGSVRSFLILGNIITQYCILFGSSQILLGQRACVFCDVDSTIGRNLSYQIDARYSRYSTGDPKDTRDRQILLFSLHCLE